LNDEAAVPALVRQLAHDKEWVRDSVSEALLKIGSEAAIRAVQQERVRQDRARSHHSRPASAAERIWNRISRREAP